MSKSAKHPVTCRSLPAQVISAMMHKYRVFLIAAFAIGAICVLYATVSFRLAVFRCVTQHKDALGRQIAYKLIEDSSTELVTIPQSLPFTVHDSWPMHYELHLRTGYRFPAAAAKRTNAVIGYFLAQPTYPLWVRAMGLIPSSEEVLVLHESFGVYAEPRSRLTELIKDW